VCVVTFLFVLYVCVICVLLLFVCTYIHTRRAYTHTHTHTTTEVEKRFVTFQILYKTCTACLHFDNIPARNYRAAVVSVSCSTLLFIWDCVT